MNEVSGTTFMVERRQLHDPKLAREWEALALQMIFHGQFFSVGWRVGVRLWREENLIRYQFFPAAPGMLDDG